MQHVGNAPVFLDAQTGNLMVDTDAIGEMESGRGGRARRAARKRNRAARLMSRADYLDDGDDDMPEARLNLVESYRLAGAANLIQENQWDGLGSTTLVASGTGNLNDTLNRTFWAKSLVMDSDDPSSILVTSITIAGMPLNIGSQGIPLSVWSRDSTRFSSVIGRRSINVGQQFRVNLSNIDTGSGHFVSGGLLGDELQPGVAQQAMEKVLIDAALAMVDVGQR